MVRAVKERGIRSSITLNSFIWLSSCDWPTTSHILHTIEYRLRLSGDHRSWKTIRDILSTHQRLTVEYNVKELEHIRLSHVRLCSNAEPEHRQIYKRLNLKEIPLPRKNAAVK